MPRTLRCQAAGSGGAQGAAAGPWPCGGPQWVLTWHMQPHADSSLGHLRTRPQRLRPNLAPRPLSPRVPTPPCRLRQALLLHVGQQPVRPEGAQLARGCLVHWACGCGHRGGRGALGSRCLWPARPAACTHAWWMSRMFLSGSQRVSAGLSARVVRARPPRFANASMRGWMLTAAPRPRSELSSAFQVLHRAQLKRQMLGKSRPGAGGAAGSAGQGAIDELRCELLHVNVPAGGAAEQSDCHAWRGCVGACCSHLQAGRITLLVVPACRVWIVAPQARGGCHAIDEPPQPDKNFRGH